jgi:hypothetical protein
MQFELNQSVSSGPLFDHYISADRFRMNARDYTAP